MARRLHPIGLILSTTGSYGAVGRSMLNGALLACRELSADPALGVTLEPVHHDPAGVLPAYAEAAEALLGQGIRHVVGCYTSSSRKDVIPLFEKRDALLWYPAHYEGFESSPNVVYTGSAPNHHISPLIGHLVSAYGDRAFCLGSNYIWAWESNRVLREDILARGGTVVAERYLAVGDTDMDRVIETIFETEPDFVFNALIGQSAYAFFRKFRAACAGRGIDQVARYPIASCNLSEPELEEIGEGAVDGHLSSSVYFASIPTARNRAFVAAYDAQFPDGPSVSVEAEAAYLAVRLLGLSLNEAGSDDVAAVQRAALSQVIDAPQGKVHLDPETFHAFLTPRIGRSRRDRQFDIVVEARAPLRPDPYMVRHAVTPAAMARPALRVVS